MKNQFQISITGYELTKAFAIKKELPNEESLFKDRTSLEKNISSILSSLNIEDIEREGITRIANFLIVDYQVENKRYF